ncbi:M67 family peptidase [Verminephrobacter aporrectodeae subsp. tuberculatae]|uniref:M67 family peptidase n=1 Tax=Verminephrobacter aporrectodeae subsp. tuberculatae TaxID=1110392 RepID=A0ABT3KP95_9BURK|nr:M67 family metallopeptidase [Verminephrobacter aporrectodeae]MCW5320095.1 M67 family peptidase [Verminephrobacter aporrectodeae subsp. tuberculatae]MCW8198762.1 M67 family peptidase [Verminephrobacter aporrectodeae subsp. tuberculatae]
MLIIHQLLVDIIVCRARTDHPMETCGVAAGPAGSGVPTRLIVMDNAAKSENYFQFDPHQQLKVWREMEFNGEEPIVIYHSHTNSSAHISQTDIQYAFEPNVHYLIVSTDHQHRLGPRSFRICNDRSVEEKVKVVSAYRDDAFNRLIDTGISAAVASV